MTKLRITTLILLFGNVGLVLFNGSMVRNNEGLRQRMLDAEKNLTEATRQVDEAEQHFEEARRKFWATAPLPCPPEAPGTPL